MPTVEIDEAELSQLQAVKRAAETMLNHPQARELVLRARKISDPSAHVPELDQAEARRTELDVLKKRQEEFEAKLTEEREREKQSAQLSALKARQDAGRDMLAREGYDAAGIKAIEDYMAANLIVDHEIGLAAYERKNPRPSPAAAHSGNIAMFGAMSDNAGENAADKTIHRLMQTQGEDAGALDTLIRSTLSDIRNPGAVRRSA